MFHLLRRKRELECRDRVRKGGAGLGHGGKRLGSRGRVQNVGDTDRKQAEGEEHSGEIYRNMEKVNRTPGRKNELRWGHTNREGTQNAGGMRTGTWGAGRRLESGERVGSEAWPLGRGPGWRAGGVPRGRGTAPARRRHHPLPDSRPPRVHSDFSAHFSSSAVTPALALPPPAAPPRSASRGKPRRSRSRPRGCSWLCAAGSPLPPCPGAPSVPTRTTCDPQVCDSRNGL